MNSKRREKAAARNKNALQGNIQSLFSKKRTKMYKNT